MLFLILPIVSAIEMCQDITPMSDIPCRVVSSWKPVTGCNRTIHIYNQSNDLLFSLNWTDYPPFCSFIFNQSGQQLYLYNSTIENGSIEVIGGDSMISLIVIGFLIILNAAIFIIPFFVRFSPIPGIKGDILDYVTKRGFWIVSLIFAYYNFIVIMHLEAIQKIGLTEVLRGFFDILTFCLYIIIGWIAFISVIVPIKMWHEYKDKIRMGDE